MNAVPIVRDVLLVGGGHSHALLIRRLAMRPQPGVRFTLVSDGVMTPYSGMLPGLVAGHYTLDEVHIDLARLCGKAGVRFIDARMTALDPDARRVKLRDRPALGFDLVSLDSGSTPDLSVPGAAEHAVPVKPVHDFRLRWQALRERVSDASAPLRIGVVGSGAGGFEILMAVRHALPRSAAELHWTLRGELPLSGRHASARRAALAAANRAGVEVHRGFDVVEVEPGPTLRAEDGRCVALDELLWCTGATGPDWPAVAGLATDERGFVLTDACLRSVSHPWVFATGDIGTQRDTPSAKAGVHAVRQSPVLYRNLFATLLGESLRAYRPQRDFLSLMATGPRHAIANRGPFTLTGAAVWRWKDRIDRRFMQRFERLPAMASMSAGGVPSVLPNALAPLVAESTMRCRGCGAKVANDLLREALAHHGGDAARAGDASVVLGVEAARDVSVIDPGGRLLVQSVDQLSAMVDDPWRFARIATLHALADLLSVPARAHSALLTLTLPPGAEAVQRRELAALLDGVVTTLAEQGVRLIGGHSAEGPELQIGLTVNALVEPAALANVAEPAASDALLLTRPLGIGVLFAGAMRGRARGEELADALALMARSQATVADTLRAHGAAVITDVTGFGLAGHLERLLDGHELGAVLEVERVPVLDVARRLASAGIASSAYASNVKALERFEGSEALSHEQRILLADPQTAGGLLAVLPEAAVGDCLASLSREPGARAAARIGTLRALPGLIVRTDSGVKA